MESEIINSISNDYSNQKITEKEFEFYIPLAKSVKSSPHFSNWYKNGTFDAHLAAQMANYNRNDLAVDDSNLMFLYSNQCNIVDDWQTMCRFISDMIQNTVDTYKVNSELPRIALIDSRCWFLISSFDSPAKDILDITVVGDNMDERDRVMSQAHSWSFVKYMDMDDFRTCENMYYDLVIFIGQFKRHTQPELDTWFSLFNRILKPGGKLVFNYLGPVYSKDQLLMRFIEKYITDELDNKIKDSKVKSLLQGNWIMKNNIEFTHGIHRLLIAIKLD